MAPHSFYYRIRWPFRIGEAVYWWPYISLKAPRPYYAGVVTQVNGPAITIWLHDGRKRTVSAVYLVYRGYCPTCEVPAVDSLGLRCPRCGESAEALPPPAELVVRWFHHGHVHSSLWLREMVLTDCTYSEARERTYAWERPPRPVSIPVACVTESTVPRRSRRQFREAA